MDARARQRGLLAAMLLLQLAWPFVCPAPLEAGHTVLGRLPAFALGVWFGMRLRAGGGFAPRQKTALAVAALVCLALLPRTPDALRLVVLLALAAALFWAVYALGQRLPQYSWGVLRRAAGWSYGVYLVHHVLLTLVLLPAAGRTGAPLAVWFPVFLLASFALAAVLTALAAPLGRALRRLAH